VKDIVPLFKADLKTTSFQAYTFFTIYAGRFVLHTRDLPAIVIVPTTTKVYIVINIFSSHFFCLTTNARIDMSINCSLVLSSFDLLLYSYEAPPISAPFLRTFFVPEFKFH
jgi:hypothetical protein